MAEVSGSDGLISSSLVVLKFPCCFHQTSLCSLKRTHGLPQMSVLDILLVCITSFRSHWHACQRGAYVWIVDVSKLFVNCFSAGRCS